MALLRPRLHLPRRSPTGPVTVPVEAPVARVLDDAPARHAMDPVEPAVATTAPRPVGPPSAAPFERAAERAFERAAELAAEPAAATSVEPPPSATAPPAAPSRPAPVRRATESARGSARPARSKKAGATRHARLLVDDESLAANGAGPRRPLRVVLVEEVPEVAAHVREMLRAQPSMKVIEVVRDGRQALHEVRELRADVVLVDVLLQGRLPGTDVIERIRVEMPGMPIVALATPGRADLVASIRPLVDGVVVMPFGSVDLSRAIRDAHASRTSVDPASGTRVVAVYAAKGGVGKTTLALNLAVALAGSGIRTALVDGSLQYGDLRRLLRVDPSEPSICDLPTDGVRASDLVGAMRCGPAGIDILFAPPRLEMADMVTARDLDAILDLLRRTYQAVVVDTPSALNDTTLTILDMADVILQVLTPESAALDSTRAAAAAFAAIGYPDAKVRTVINRADAVGGLRPDQLRRALGRDPDHVIASDWQLVAGANQEGIPFVVARPDAPVSRDVLALAGSMAQVLGAAPPRVPTRARGRPLPVERRAVG